MRPACQPQVHRPGSTSCPLPAHDTLHIDPADLMRLPCLAPLLLFAVLAVLAGATSYRRIRLFIGVHRERLNATFGARFRRAPAVNTLRALVHALDPAAIEA